MNTRTSAKVDLVKKLNPDLKKLHKYHNTACFFSNQFDWYSDDPLISSSYIFDGSDNAYELNQKLGKGSFGIVKKGTLVTSGQTVAIKIQNLTRQTEYHFITIGDKEKARLYVNNQIKVEDSLLKLTGQLISTLTRMNQNNEMKHYSIMQYIDGVQLKDIFHQLSAPEKIACFIQVTEQAAFLHANNYLHLDIWPENILFSNDKAILHDYGCSAKLENGCFLSKLKGSHIPPEVLLAFKKNEAAIYGTYSDIYGLGMTFFELLYGEYYDHSIDKTLHDFSERYGEYHKAIIGFLSSKNDLLSQLISKMVSMNPSDRTSIDDVLANLKLIKENTSLNTALNNSNSQVQLTQF